MRAGKKQAEFLNKKKKPILQTFWRKQKKIEHNTQSIVQKN